MKGFSLAPLVRRGWMVIVSVLVVALAGFGIYRLHGIFGSHDN
ncbi:MmpS family transport accessory protein, partial [Mycobacterium intracellulare]